MGKAIEDLPLAQIGAALRDGTLHAEAVFEWAEANHESRGRLLNAYCHWDAEQGRAVAKEADAIFNAGQDQGLLQGIPISVKDCFGVESTRTFCGTSAPLPACYELEGPLVRGIRRQLAPITGKTHTDEFCYGGIGAVNHGPTPRNPWDARHHRVAGGSSSGAGISLIEGSALVALASDTSGSVRRPASATGVVGLKLTMGRWSTEGIVPLSRTLDTPGFLTRTVADAAYVFSALDSRCDGSKLSNLDRDVAGMRLGICKQHFWDDCSPGVAEGVHEALKELEAAGASLIDIDFPEADEANAVVMNGGIVAAEFCAFLERRLSDRIDGLHPLLGRRLSGTDKPNQSALDYLGNLVSLDSAAERAADTLATVDALVTPTFPPTPPKLSEIDELEDYEEVNRLGVRNTYIPSLLKLCAISLPVALDRAGLPVGMQLIAPAMSEEVLLALSCQIENTLGDGRQRLGVASEIDA